MIAQELNRPSDVPGSGLSPTLDHQALTMALAILVERIRGLPADDKHDLFALVKEIPNSDAEELESIVITMREILEQAPSSIQRMRGATSQAPHAPGLKKWMDFVSQRIVEARTVAGLTQSELAEKSGLPQSHISRLECGKHSPSRVTLERIASALGIPVSNLDPSAE
jgi:DNA-binding XRE family transcriptional regulator